jgi:hypothetical protein
MCAARASRLESAAVVVARRGKNGSRRVHCSLRSPRLALLRQPGSVRRRAICRRSQRWQKER